MNQDRKILLSFDVEEFDLPLEYKQIIGPEEQLATGYKGLVEIRNLLKNKNIPATLFTTAFFAEHFPDEMRSLAKQHELASHAYYHSSFQPADLKKSKEKLEDILQ